MEKIIQKDESNCLEEFQKRTDLPQKGQILNGFVVIGVGVVEATLDPVVVAKQKNLGKVVVFPLYDWERNSTRYDDVPWFGSPNTPQKGQIYKHYKGNTYKVIELGFAPFSGEPLVIYEDTNRKYNFYWVRTEHSWATPIDENGTPRFTLITL